MPPDRAAQN